MAGLGHVTHCCKRPNPFIRLSFRSAVLHPSVCVTIWVSSMDVDKGILSGVKRELQLLFRALLFGRAKVKLKETI